MPEQVRLTKKVAIARSGVQLYTPHEVRAMGIKIPKDFQDRRLLGVYRSAPLLAAKKDLFAKQPFINTHKGFVDPKNFSKWAQGWTGDSIDIEMNEAGTEAVITGELNILGQEAIDALDDGTRQVSPHYFGTYDWAPGVAPDGTEFQVIATDLTMVNHVALVPRGRGGPDAAIQDAAPGPFSAIWNFITGKFKKGGAADEMSFRQSLEEIAKLRGTLTPEQLMDKSQVLYDCVRKMPMSEDTDLLYRYLGDLPILAEDKTDEEAVEFVTIVAGLYESIEERSLAEIMEQQKQANEKAQEDGMTEREKKAEEEAKAAKDAENKELEEHLAKVKDHMAAGGKASDFKIGSAKDEEAEEEAKKKKAEEEKAAADAEAAEAEKKAKEEEESKAKAAEDSAPSVLGIYDHAPFTMGMGGSGYREPSEAGNNLLKQAGFLPQEKK